MLLEINLPAKTPIRTSTQQFLEIEDIQNDIVLLKNGACALVLQVTAINFSLLSEGEQDALIYAYASLLNSLSFPIQIVVRSKKKDISSYLQFLKNQESKIKKPALLEQMKKYRQFVETTVKENRVLDKKFYISLPFSPLELGVSSTLAQTFKPQKGLPLPKLHILERAKTNLYPKRDHLIGQLGRLGLKAEQLPTQKLLELFYNIYNPESTGQNFVASKDYATPLVQAATTQLENSSALQNKKEVLMDKNANISTNQGATPPTTTGPNVEPTKQNEPQPVVSPSPTPAPSPSTTSDPLAPAGGVSTPKDPVAPAPAPKIEKPEPIVSPISEGPGSPVSQAGNVNPPSSSLSSSEDTSSGVK